jgi:hypothetical protein
LRRGDAGQIGGGGVLLVDIYIIYLYIFVQHFVLRVGQVVSDGPKRLDSSCGPERRGSHCNLAMKTGTAGSWPSSRHEGRSRNHVSTCGTENWEVVPSKQRVAEEWRGHDEHALMIRPATMKIRLVDSLCV